VGAKALGSATFGKLHSSLNGGSVRAGPGGRSASLHVRRLKTGKPSVHPLRGDEIRALRQLRRQFPDSAFVFATKRGGPSHRPPSTG